MNDARVPSVLDCMHCGFCLQACPTYLETGDENESPRGRLFLMRAVEEGRLPIDSAATQHLDHCLDCRACETACPSGVEYSRVLEPFRIRQRTELPAKRASLGDRWAEKIRTQVLPDRKRLKRWLAPARLAQRIGVDRLAQQTGATRLLPSALRRMNEQLPRLSHKVDAIPEISPSQTGEVHARVGLLLGCAGEVFTPRVNRAAVEVLTRLGCEVHAPQAQGCCGALAYHEGRAQAAQQDWRELAASFGDLSQFDAIITTAAGCGSMLLDLQRVSQELEIQSPALTDLSSKAIDFHAYVAKLEWPSELAPIAGRAAYDPACHLLHAQGVTEQPLSLLKQIPGLELCDFDEADICCGAAGSYVLTQPEFSDRIGERKARHLIASGAEFVLSANVGCSMQIERCTKALGYPLRVLHPAELLASALGDGSLTWK